MCPGLVSFFVAVIAMSVQPTAYADECYTYPNRYLGYFTDCGCRACAGWAISNCYECTDGNGNWWSTSGPCGPFEKDPI
jgi:hypothetical protein